MPDGMFSIGGNSKVGPGVGNINRVPVETCPGSSEWCSKYCYARRGTFPLWFDEYSTEINVPNILPKLVRVHSSGDFDSVKYIKWMMDLVKSNESTQFWAYTRSWRVDELLPHLNGLTELDNFVMFASMDTSIQKEPPSSWRKAWLDTDKRAKGIMCPHDKGEIETCAECGLCYGDSEVDVIFKTKYE